MLNCLHLLFNNSYYIMFLCNIHCTCTCNRSLGLLIIILPPVAKFGQQSTPIITTSLCFVALIHCISVNA